MANRRRSIGIPELIQLVNTRNRESTCAPEVRQGWNALLEAVLFGANVYAGYTYLREEDVPKGHLPGVTRDEAGHSTGFPDETRRYYLKHHSLGAGRMQIRNGKVKGEVA